MNTLLLPDFFAMSMLLGVLALIRRRYPRSDIRVWTGSLLLILLECAARLMYGMRLPTLWHNAAHVVSLDAYLLAGVLFLRSSLESLRRLPRAGLFVAVNSVLPFILLTMYGAGLNRERLMLAVCLAAVAVAVASSLILRRSAAHLCGIVAMWLPVTVAVLLHQPRTAVYVLLALLYLLTALMFSQTLPQGSSGKIAVVAGFAMWSACFATHPWIAVDHAAWVPLVSEIWNLQKFIITVGFLLVLFEKQVDGNEWLALHDQLTGLPNRRLFHDRIGNAIGRAERNRTSLILFAMDLNNFKEVNDTLGHDAGDALLRSIANSLGQVIRRTDTLARMGGDEFILLATDVKADQSLKKERRWLRPGETSLDDPSGLVEGVYTPHDTDHPVLRHASRIEQEIRTAINQPVILSTLGGTHTVEVSISIGIAVYPADGTDLAELTRIADGRMYDDKRRQRSEMGSLDRMLSMLTV